jgi:redox-sensitive bicupin YhaK (pirin superfamily)
MAQPSGQRPIGARVMALLEPDAPARLSCESESRLIIIGGDPLAKPVRMWWNFVSTDIGKIERAAQRWRLQEFPVVQGETELVAMPPLPRPPAS